MNRFLLHLKRMINLQYSIDALINPATPIYDKALKYILLYIIDNHNGSVSLTGIKHPLFDEIKITAKEPEPNRYLGYIEVYKNKPISENIPYQAVANIEIRLDPHFPLCINSDWDGFTFIFQRGREKSTKWDEICWYRKFHLHNVMYTRNEDQELLSDIFKEIINFIDADKEIPKDITDKHITYTLVKE